MPLPPFHLDHPKKDNWLTVARVRAAAEAQSRSAVAAPLEGEEHIF
jgi:hypothetical protein